MTRLAQVELDGGRILKCSCPEDLAIHEGDLCVAESGRALEFGRIGSLIEGASGEEKRDMPHVIRRATLQDQSHAGENAVYLKMVTDTCCRKAEEHKLDMQIVDVRQSFDRKAVTIAYTADERVQFRDMVRELARELRARIEMKQIGVRDAAGLVGGMGPCGRKLCCSTWLQRFDAVSVRMAKNQRLSLNPNTISGVCGRLKCCLRYENECYSQLCRGLPRDGAKVTCPAGKGYVLDTNILGQRVKVRLEDDRILEFGVDEVKVERR